MLSKKMAFSLMRLITILALAFVVSSAMAQDFDTTLSVQDISFADGNQVEVTTSATNVIVNATFAKVVNQADIHEKITLLVYNKFGGLLTVPTIDASSVEAVLRHYRETYTITFQIAATADDSTNPYRAKLHVAEGIVAAAVDDDTKSKTTNIDIYFVGPDPTPSDPMPVSIELANNLLVPVAGFTGASFDIIVTLSEAPKEGRFTKDHLEVDKGTAADGVYLGAMDPPQGQTATGRSGNYHLLLFTITPKVEGGDLVIKIKSFEDQEKPIPNRYNPPTRDLGRTPGTDILTVKIKRVTATALVDGAEGGNRIALPTPTPTKGTTGATADATAEAAEAAATATAETVKVEVTAAVADEADADLKAVDTSVRIPEVGQIYISEIMFSGGGRLPQWIEIANGSKSEEVNLSGWTLMVENATADADVSVGTQAVFTIPEGIRIDPSGQPDTPSTILVVTETGRNNLTGAMADGQVVNLWREQQVKLILLGVMKRRYSLLSSIGFRLTLAPPATLITTPAADATDVVGNLSADGTAAWALPMAEGHARSSIIRRHVAGSVGPAEPKDGEMLESWVLASDTKFTDPTHLSAHSYYGLPIDVGTPGFRAGGALPVELSHFRPVRDKETGAVVITWSTQSELNNAGFFIKRSQQRDGEFQIVNATMIPGAGTTSEKQFYTYQDTTAQPNVVYYYQIEDVSLDGNRQTLTRGIRLKGHVGAAGKLTTLWGDLKTSQ